MSIRDFIRGDERTKDTGESQIIIAATVFGCRVVEIVQAHIDSIPVELKDDLQEAVDWFLSGVGEFIDVDEVLASFGDAD